MKKGVNDKFWIGVVEENYKCLDTQGEWDGTYDTSYRYDIYDENNIQVDGFGGYRTKEEAREAGEKCLAKWLRL